MQVVIVSPSMREALFKCAKLRSILTISAQNMKLFIKKKGEDEDY